MEFLTGDEQIAIWFLVYLLIPLLAFLIYWAVGYIRRRVLKKGGDEAAREGEA